MGTAEGAVEAVEGNAHGPQPVDVGEPDAGRSAVPGERVLGADEPGHRGVVPRGHVRRRVQERRGVAEVGVEQLRDGARAVLWRIRVGESRVG